ncbi:hypothetical protein PtA15_3A91 [Puccinia triticina]|uniref:Uncharacterized protein n=1 Tax=Puccinia triticina TaxID=208348 RepID=A0ABY7CFL1_9BASI|nr:uncharacterized protein PtA15_3A91 [Puccinia triticina]WAQ82727.1 hypothetical protein PtA15_3A91 [Puccinia triticina]
MENVSNSPIQIVQSTLISVKSPIDILKFDPKAFSAGKSPSQKDRLRVSSIVGFINSNHPKIDELYITERGTEEVRRTFKEIVIFNLKRLIAEDNKAQIEEKSVKMKELNIPGIVEFNKKLKKYDLRNDPVNEIWLRRALWFRFWNERANLELFDDLNPKRYQITFKRNLTCLLLFVEMIGLVLRQFLKNDSDDRNDINSNLLKKAYDIAYKYPRPYSSKAVSNVSKLSSDRVRYPANRQLTKLEVVWYWTRILIDSSDHDDLKEIFFPKSPNGGRAPQICAHTQAFFNNIFGYSIQQLNKRLAAYYEHKDHCKQDSSGGCLHGNLVFFSS